MGAGSDRSRSPRVAALRVGGEPETWRQLGFEISAGAVIMLGTVRIELLSSAELGAIASWALDGADLPAAIDGLATDADERGANDPPAHPNGAVAIDHVVVLTPSLERTTAAFEQIGAECRRIRKAGGGVRQGFFLVGDLLVEVVEGPGAGPQKPARFWGITVVVEEIEHAASLLGDRLGDVKEAVQRGRRIATVRREAAGGLPLALITPRRRKAAVGGQAIARRS